jgi:hypothetical protein
MDQFDQCEVRWDYIYNKGIKMAPGFAMIQGSSFHAAEDVNFKHKIEKGRDMKLSAVKDALVDDFKERVRARKVVINQNSIQVSEKEAALKPNDIQNQALRALTSFHLLVAPAVIPTGSEVAGEIELNGLAKPANLRFVMDLIGKPISQDNKGRFHTAKKGVAIFDWKLVGKALDRFELDRSFQYPAYIGAYSSIYGGKAPDQFALLATIKTKVPKIQMLSVQPKMEKVKWFLDRIARVLPVMEDIRAGKRLPRPAALHPSFLSPCKPGSCGLWTICKVRPR